MTEEKPENKQEPTGPVASKEPKESDDIAEEAGGETSGQISKDDGGNLTSPEGILMLCIAGIIDAISLVPAINVLSDILAFLIIGGWLVVTRPGEALKQVAKKFFIVFGIEAIPIVSIAPTWTWFVYKTLKAG